MNVNQSTKLLLSGQKPRRAAEAAPQQHVSISLTTMKKPSIGQKPVFIQPIRSCLVPHGEVARFHACVSGLPKPEINWFHNQQPIQPTKNVVFHFEEATNTATLIIVDAFTEHAGEYTCRAANSAGEAACSATLTIDKVQEEGNLWIHRSRRISSFPPLRDVPHREMNISANVDIPMQIYGIH